MSLICIERRCFWLVKVYFLLVRILSTYFTGHPLTKLFLLENVRTVSQSNSYFPLICQGPQFLHFYFVEFLSLFPPVIQIQITNQHPVIWSQMITNECMSMAKFGNLLISIPHWWKTKAGNALTFITRESSFKGTICNINGLKHPKPTRT